jgi:hypothetical protein
MTTKTAPVQEPRHYIVQGSIIPLVPQLGIRGVSCATSLGNQIALKRRQNGGWYVSYSRLRSVIASTICGRTSTIGAILCGRNERRAQRRLAAGEREI